MQTRWAMAMTVLLGWAVAGCAGSTAGVDLAAMGGWDIVVGAQAQPAERYAAEEFQRFFAEAAGVRLPIAGAASGAGGHVFIGPDAAGFDVAGFGPEDLRIVVRPGAVLIAGGRPRGTLYGVYTFLEDYAGVRFLTSDHTHVPKIAGPAVIAPVDRSYRPPLSFRWSYYGEMGRDAAFATRMRANTVTNDERFGGRTPVGLINHSFGRYLPWKTYGKDHPEYFCEIGGRRPAEVADDQYDPGVEPCLTNPDVLRIVTEAVLRDLDEHPEWRSISVSQNDNTRFCTCTACRAIDEREGSPMGSLLTFVNAVADEVAKRHPDVLVGTLAYKYSRKPPLTITPRPNVQIQLCSIECCMNHAIDDPGCPLNVPFCADMEAWGRICKNIYVWHYNTNFADYLLPCPNLRVIEPDVRYFVRNGAHGVMMQGAYNALGAEFSELRNYVTSRLLWDPALDGHQLVDEFLRLHYAEAAGPIQRYIDFIHDKAAASGRHQRCSRPGAHYGLDREAGETGLKLFGEAMALARSEEVKRRVEKASVCAHAMMVDALLDADSEMTIYWRMRRHRPLLQTRDADLLAAARPHLRRIFEISDACGITMPSEWISWAQVRKAFRELYGLSEAEQF